MTNYKYYNYKDTEQDLTHKPASTHTTTEKDSDTLYFVDDADETKLYKRVISTKTETLITTRTKKIVRSYPDLTNDKIYYVDSNYDRGTSYVWYLDLADDSIYEEINKSADIFDIFKMENDIYIIYFIEGYSHEMQEIVSNGDVLTNWDVMPGGTHWSTIDEAHATPNTTDYIQMKIYETLADSFTMTTIDMTGYDSAGIVDQVYQIVIRWYGSILTFSPSCWVRGNKTGMSNKEITFWVIPWKWRSVTFSNLSLVQADLDDLEISIQKQTANSEYAKIACMYAEIFFYGDTDTEIVIEKISDNSKHTQNMGIITNRSYLISQFVVESTTEGYFLWKWSDEDVELWKYDKTAGTITQKLSSQSDHGSDVNLVPLQRSALSYDEDNIISYVLGDGKEEISSVQCVYATISDGEYFDINAIDENGIEKEYRIWFDKTGGGSAPASGDRELVEITIAVATDQGTSDALQDTMNNLKYLAASNDDAPTTTVIIQSVYNGSITDITDGDTGLTMAVDTQGTNNTYYYYTYDIAADIYDKKGIYDVCLMMNRNSNSSNDIPYNLEKGFHFSEKDKIYQISKSRGNLWLISVYNFINTIVALTDTYAIDSDKNLYKYQDFMNRIVEWWVDHGKEDYPKAEVQLRSDYIAVQKNMLMQLIGPYSSYASLKLYKATENFEDETIGTIGTSIDLVDVSNGNIDINEGLKGHYKVIKIEDDDNTAHNFRHNLTTNQTYGSIEVKILSSDATKECTITFYDSSDNVVSAIKMDADNWYTYSASSWTDQTELGTPADDTWYRVRMNFETTAGSYLSLSENTYQVYINEVPLDSATALETSDTNISYFIISSQAADQDYDIYFDSYGCPQEDSTYTLEDNKYVEKGQANQVCFEGLVKGYDSRTIRAVRLESPASEMDRVKPSGSKAGRTDEIITDINDDANGITYISDGTFSNGAAMGTLEFAGDKTWRSIVENFKDQDTFTWYLLPTGELNYDNGELDTGVVMRYNGSTHTDKIEDANGFFIASNVNQVIVRGTIGIESDPANDEADQQINGIILYIVRDASLNTKALCNTKASAILARSTDIATIEAMPVFDDYGFVQPGQVFTFMFVTTDVSIAEDTFTIDYIKFEAKSERYSIVATNGLTFKIGD